MLSTYISPFCPVNIYCIFSTAPSSSNIHYSVRIWATLITTGSASGVKMLGINKLLTSSIPRTISNTRPLSYQLQLESVKKSSNSVTNSVNQSVIHSYKQNSSLNEEAYQK